MNKVDQVALYSMSEHEVENYLRVIKTEKAMTRYLHSFLCQGMVRKCTMYTDETKEDMAWLDVARFIAMNEMITTTSLKLILEKYADAAKINPTSERIMRIIAILSASDTEIEEALELKQHCVYILNKAGIETIGRDVLSPIKEESHIELQEVDLAYPETSEFAAVTLPASHSESEE